MPYDPALLRNLVHSPSEGVNVEIKGWILPDTNEGIAKIVKTIIALRNANGGYLLIGLDNTTGALDEASPRPTDLREVYSTDAIQGLVSKYASTPIPVEVHFIERGSDTFPVVCVPSGNKTVVAAKKELKDPNDASRFLVKEHQVYIRSLSASGVVSTTEPKWKDWDQTIETCLNNREADIASFMRRVFGKASPAEVAAALDFITYDPKAQLDEFQNAQFNRMLRRFHAQHRPLPQAGSWNVSVLFTGASPQDHRTTEEFLNLMMASNPRLTSFPLWIDSRRLPQQENRPYVSDGQWEALVVTTGGRFNFAEFWSIHPQGKMFEASFYEDDLVAKDVQPRTVLDFKLVLSRVAEAFLVPLSFARKMEYPPEDSTLHFKFQWKGLRGRTLNCWSDPMRSISTAGNPVDDEVSSYSQVSLDSGPAIIPSLVQNVTRPLFEAFGGFQLSSTVVDDIVTRFLNQS